MRTAVEQGNCCRRAQADFSHEGTPGAGFIRVTLQLDKDTQLHVYNTHLHYRDPKIRRQELIFNQKVIDKENLPQTIEIGGLEVVNYEKLVTIDQLQSAATYEEYEGITLKQY